MVLEIVDKYREESMTREEASFICSNIDRASFEVEMNEALDMAIKALEQEPTKREIEREYLFQSLCEDFKKLQAENDDLRKRLEQEPKTGYCKDCKYFEYDSVAKVDGVPLIVAHEICSKWGDGCKTKEDGYCFLFEP